MSSSTNSQDKSTEELLNSLTQFDNTSSKPKSISKMLTDNLTGASASSESINTTKFDSCTDFYSEFSKCMSPAFQFNHINKHGQHFDCSPFMSDTYKCFISQLKNSEEEKLKLFRETYRYNSLNKPINNIFDYKEKPSW